MVYQQKWLILAQANFKLKKRIFCQTIHLIAKTKVLYHNLKRLWHLLDEDCLSKMWFVSTGFGSCWSSSTMKSSTCSPIKNSIVSNKPQTYRFPIGVTSLQVTLLWFGSTLFCAYISCSLRFKFRKVNRSCVRVVFWMTNLATQLTSRT